MEIYILFSCDNWKTYGSRMLRGVFTDEELLEKAKRKLIRNKVVDQEDNLDTVTLEENAFEPEGGYY